MGFLDKLFQRDAPKTQPDSVWQTHAARLAGLAARTRRHRQEGQVLLLAHFPETLASLTEALGEPAADSREVADALSSPSRGGLAVGLVSQLPVTPPVLYGEMPTAVSLLVAERHPLRAEDERVNRLAAALPYEATVRFHLSFEDSLLHQFANEQVAGLLRQLGMGADDEITHPLVSRAVENAQERLAERAGDGSTPEAQSFDDWVRSIEPE